MHPVHVLLAGDKDYAPYLVEGRNKCLLEFSSGKLLDLTLAALGSATEVKTLLVIGPELLASKVRNAFVGKPMSFLPQKGSFSQNVHAALCWVQQNRPGSRAIFVTNDAPLLTSAELNRFATLVVRQDADINIAVATVAPDRLNEPLVRQYVRSIVALSDGLYLLGNQVALSSESIRLVKLVQGLFDLRKQSKLETSIRTFFFVLEQWRSIHGIGIWLRVVLGKRIWLARPASMLISRVSVPLSKVESSLERLLGNRFRVRINKIPEALGCFDADTEQQLDELRNVLASKIESESKLRAASG